MKPTQLAVQAIFRSVDGEANGYFGAGQPTTFIRLRGCNLRCTYCDTTYAQEEDSGASVGALGLMTPEEILRKTMDFPGRKVTLTGGDPLVQLPGVTDLIGELLQARFDIAIETNGSIPVRRCGLHLLPRVPVRSGVGVAGHGSLRFVVDYKLPSSGMEDQMNGTLWHDLTEYDVMKFVISDDVDFERALKVIRDHSYCKARMVFSPAINLNADNPMEWPAELASRLLKHHNLPCNINYSLQIHKVLWPNATTER